MIAGPVTLPALAQSAAGGSERPAGPAKAPVSPEVLQQLLARLEVLEARERERAAQTNPPAGAEVNRLVARLHELEAKVAALESGRVLPEITVPADDAGDLRALASKVETLEQKSTDLAARADKQAKESPRLSLGGQGIAFTSADTNFTLKLKGLVQTDAQAFFNDNPLLDGNDSFNLRRARAIIQGTFFKDFDFLLVPQYGGFSDQAVQLLDAYVGYRLGGRFELRAGKFKGPVGLELLQSIALLPFSERSLVSNLVPQRNVGAQLSGEFFNGTVSVAAGVFNATGDLGNGGTVAFTDEKEFAGRVFAHPFRHSSLKWLNGLGFGAGGSFSQVSSNAAGLPLALGDRVAGYYTTPAAQQFFAYNPLAGPVVADGEHWRLSPQGYYYFGPFGLLGEYAISRQGVYNSTTFRSADVSHSAWQITADWVLTGEPSSYHGIHPRRPFSLRDGGWGAWQLVGRFSQFDVDDEVFNGFSNPAFSATEAMGWAVGINWWLNRNVRLLNSFSYTTFEGGGAAPNIAAPGTLEPPTTVTAQPEAVFSSRLQLSF